MTLNLGAAVNTIHKMTLNKLACFRCGSKLFKILATLG
jgi:hypothetical protein